MADKTSVRKELSVNQGGKMVLLNTGSGSPTGGVDTLTMVLADYGFKNVLAVQGYVHTTDLNIIVEESGTTAVANGILTYTTAAGNNGSRRVVVVWGE